MRLMKYCPRYRSWISGPLRLIVRSHNSLTWKGGLVFDLERECRDANAIVIDPEIGGVCAYICFLVPNSGLISSLGFEPKRCDLSSDFSFSVMTLPSAVYHGHQDT